MQDAPSPESVSDLKSYLGLLTYYSKFLLNMADVLAPLYRPILRRRLSKPPRLSKKLLVLSQLLWSCKMVVLWDVITTISVTVWKQWHQPVAVQEEMPEEIVPPKRHRWHPDWYHNYWLFVYHSSASIIGLSLQLVYMEFIWSTL